MRAGTTKVLVLSRALLASFSTGQLTKRNRMTQPHHRTVKAQTAATSAKLGVEDQALVSCMRKLRAVERVALDILSRVQRILQENPAAIIDEQAAMLPRELEDQQSYFLEKIGRAQKTLKELTGLLLTGPENLVVREQISVELMVFFVLIDLFRTQRIRESGWDPGEGMEELIQQKVESLSLDVINMRERLK